MMNVVFQLSVTVFSVVVLLTLMAIVHNRAKALGLRAEVQRKLVHIGTGMYALILPVLFTDDWPVLMLLSTTALIMLFLRQPKQAASGLGSTLHSVGRKSYGDLSFVLAVATVYLLAKDTAILYVLPLAILTLSDAAAALAGSAYGIRFFTVDDGQKSFEGSLVFFITSFCLSMVCLLLLSETPRLNVVILSIVVAGFGTLVEAESWRGLDNFFLPIALYLFLERHLDTPPSILLMTMGFFLFFVIAAQFSAAKMNLSNHTSTVYMIAAFLLLATLDFSHAVLPLLMFFAHVVCSRFNPCNSLHPELDAVAATALFSIFWLVLGRYGGSFNIPLYGLTTLSLILYFVCLTVGRGKSVVSTWLGLSIVAVSMVSYRYFYLYSDQHINVVSKGLEVMNVSLPLFIFAILVPTIPAVLKPEWFNHSRVKRGTMLALIVPVFSYVLNMWG